MRYQLLLNLSDLIDFSRWGTYTYRLLLIYPIYMAFHWVYLLININKGFVANLTQIYFRSHWLSSKECGSLRISIYHLLLIWRKRSVLLNCGPGDCGSLETSLLGCEIDYRFWLVTWLTKFNVTQWVFELFIANESIVFIWYNKSFLPLTFWWVI